MIRRALFKNEKRVVIRFSSSCARTTVLTYTHTLIKERAGRKEDGTFCLRFQSATNGFFLWCVHCTYLLVFRSFSALSHQTITIINRLCINFTYEIKVFCLLSVLINNQFISSVTERMKMKHKKERTAVYARS